MYFREKMLNKNQIFIGKFKKKFIGPMFWHNMTGSKIKLLKQD